MEGSQKTMPQISNKRKNIEDGRDGWVLTFKVEVQCEKRERLCADPEPLTPFDLFILLVVERNTFEIILCFKLFFQIDRGSVRIGVPTRSLPVGL